jgi:large subunit ribosomal protein L22e
VVSSTLTGFPFLSPHTRSGFCFLFRPLPPSQLSKAAAKLAKAASKSKRPKKDLEYLIKVRDVVEADIFDVAAFEEYLAARIKAKKGGKAGELGTDVTISTTPIQAKIITKVPLSKRYVKYLTKKFLKKNLLRDHCRVIATGKKTYTIVPYKAAAAALE